MKGKLLNIICGILIVVLLAIFIIRFAAPMLLRTYVELGIGDCRKVPVFCMAPQEEIANPPIDRAYINELLFYEFPKMTIFAPKGFNVVNQRIQKNYYKKWPHKGKDAVIYLIIEEPNFFVNLYPQLKAKGVVNDYEFIKRIMYARIKQIKGLTDTFFIIMKGIFTPDLGEQKKVRMVKFSIPTMKGFINYQMGSENNYFDCNIINENGYFFKIYIKDKGAQLDLNKVFAIISTATERK